MTWRALLCGAYRRTTGQPCRAPPSHLKKNQPKKGRPNGRQIHELRALLESGFQLMREEMTAFRDEIRGEIGEIKATLQVHLMRLAALQESIGSVQR
jgi:hypothetical protein